MKFAIWGVSFKPGTNDVRGSVSIYIINQIIKFGGKVSAYDPHAIENIKKIYKNKKNIIFENEKYTATNNSNALILLTEWPEFRCPNFNVLKTKLINPVIFDGRNQFNKYELKKLGFEYYQIGSPLL